MWGLLLCIDWAWFGTRSGCMCRQMIAALTPGGMLKLEINSPIQIIFSRSPDSPSSQIRPPLRKYWPAENEARNQAPPTDQFHPSPRFTPLPGNTPRPGNTHWVFPHEMCILTYVFYTFGTATMNVCKWSKQPCAWQNRSSCVHTKTRVGRAIFAQRTGSAPSAMGNLTTSTTHVLSSSTAFTARNSCGKAASSLSMQHCRT